ncbi:MAG: hypothetical protein ACFB01_16055, partial [Cohaesibacteraceae bacterium]
MSKTRVPMTRVLAGVCAVLAILAVPGAALAQLDAQPMRFTLVDDDVDCPDCRYIRAAGDIEAYTAAQFRQFVRNYNLQGQGLTVVLNSPGGDVVAGLRFGRDIRDFGLHTQVGRAQPLTTGGHSMRTGDCASSCTFSFLGCGERYAEDDVIGGHRFYPGHMEPDERGVMRPGDEAVSAMIKVYAMDMGVDAGFIDMSLNVPPSDMRYMSNRELRDMAVVNMESPL